MHQVQKTATVEHTQAKAQNLDHGRNSDSILDRLPLGYESRQYTGDLAVLWSLNANADCLRLCEVATSSLPPHFWYLFFSPYLY